MKWFYVILIAAAAAGITVAIQRVTHAFHSNIAHGIVAISLVVIFIALFQFLAKMRE